MKKVLYFLFSAMLLCACRGPQGPAGDGVNWKIVPVVVQAANWQYNTTADKTNSFFSAYRNMPEITSYVFNEGNVQGYIYLNDNGETIQHALPYVLHKEIIGTDGSQYTYTTTVDFVFGVGWVQFEMRDSDFAYETDASINPEQMTFRIVITY